MIVYVARYGRQSINEVRAWPKPFLFEVRDALDRIVALENDITPEG